MFIRAHLLSFLLGFLVVGVSFAVPSMAVSIYYSFTFFNSSDDALTTKVDALKQYFRQYWTSASHEQKSRNARYHAGERWRGEEISLKETH